MPGAAARLFGRDLGPSSGGDYAGLALLYYGANSVENRFSTWLGSFLAKMIYPGFLVAILAHHHGFKRINIGMTDFVFLFYLDGIPAFFQAEFAFLLFARRGAS
jgi:hypothetical protein